jgi:tetratricopeptide (TPR) repeat protein
MMRNKNLYPPDHLKENMVCEIEDRIELLLIRADYFVQAGDIEHAFDCYDKVLEIKPTCVDAWIGIGVAYLKQNRQADAKDIFQKALLIQPDSKQAAIGMALVHYDNGNLKDALVMIRQAQNAK